MAALPCQGSGPGRRPQDEVGELVSFLSVKGTARLAFVATLVAVLLLTGVWCQVGGSQALPVPAMFERLGNDKVEHMLAFFTLAVLGGLGWPQARAWLATALLVVGALIEVLQGTSLIHRDMDVMDWLADAAGIMLGMALVGLMLRMSPRAA